MISASALNNEHIMPLREPRGASSFQVRGTSPIRSGSTVERGAVPQMGALGLKNCGEGAYTATCGPIEEHGVRGLELARKIIPELCCVAQRCAALAEDPGSFPPARFM